MLKSSFASRSTSPTSPSCRSPSRSHSLPRRCRWRSTRRRTGATMADERRILLVEDDVLIGMMLVDMLDTLGYPEPAQAAAIDEALAIVDVGPVAAALIDINLGEIGSASCRERGCQ